VDFGSFCKGAYLARDFVNTKAWFSGKERLTGPDEVRALLRRHDLDRRVAKAEIPRIHELRDRVRSVFAAADEVSVRRQIATLLADYPSRPELAASGEGGVTFAPVGNDAVSWLGANVATGLAFFVAQHGTARLGLCGASDCDDAFVDESKNHTKHYCSVGCTRNENVRAFRARKRKSETA